jgi:hypothetical protein
MRRFSNPLDNALITHIASIKIFLKLAAVFVLVLWASTASAQTTRYMSTTGTDNGNCSSSNSPCATFSYSFGQMSGGDTLIVANGTYNQCINTPPSGTGSGATAYTTIKAQTDFGVTLTGTTCGGNPGAVIDDYSGNYIVFQGFIANGGNATTSAQNQPVVTVGEGATCCTTNHVKFIRMGITGGSCEGNDDAFGTTGTSYVLLEDVHIWGCFRYGVDIYHSQFTVLRRVVSRFDFLDCGTSSNDWGWQTSPFTIYDSDFTSLQNVIAIDSGIKNGSAATCDQLFGGVWWEDHADVLFGGILERTGEVFGSIFLNNHSMNNSTNSSTQNPVGIQSQFKIAGNTTTRTEENNVYWDIESGGSYGIYGDDCTPSCGSPALSLSHNLYGSAEGTYGGGDEYTLGVGVANACNDPTMPGAGYSCAGVFSSNGMTNTLLLNNNSYGNDGEPGDYNDYYGNGTNYKNISAGANDLAVNPQLKYLPRIESTSPLHGAASDGGDIGPNFATSQYEYGCSGCLWGDTGFDAITSTPLWPFPYEAQVKSDFSSYGCNVATCNGTNNPPAIRGFVASGNGLYGGPITLTSYIWEYLGNACPSDVCNYSQTQSPTFTPGSGTYSSAQSVTIGNPAGAPVICWSTSGNPATNGATGCSVGSAYTGAIEVSASETIYAVAGGTGLQDSVVASANYTIGASATAATPTFSPAAGTYSSSQTVTITSSTSGATICYTTNGSTPAASTAGTCSTGATLTNGGSITVSTSETVRALATLSGDTNSLVASAAFTINVPVTAGTPTFSPAAGTYSSAQTVTISSSTSSATICYTTNGSTPSANTAGTCSNGTALSNGGSITVAASETIAALATLSGDTNSSVASASYTINAVVTAATPTFSPVAGTYSSAQTVTITSSTSGATICYTTNGNTPAASTAGTCSSGTALANGGSITVSASETVRALATLSGDTNSSVASAAYTITVAAANPTFSPATGTYSSAQTVTITSSTSGATICYTTNGSAPTATTPGTCSNGTTLTNGSSITVSSSETVRALATLSGDTNSSVSSAAYTISIPVVATPTFSPAGGSYSSNQTVAITSSTSGATICYTTNGTTPSASTAGTCSNGTALTNGGSVTVSATQTLEAIGTLSGDTNSSVAVAAYIITIPVAGTPAFSPAAGSYTGTQTVRIASPTSGATICYTTNGSAPSATTAGTCSNGTALTNGGSVTVSATQTLEALATLSGDTNSSVAVAAYTITIPVVGTPTFSPTAGSYSSAQTVAITSSTSNATICYTTNGATPAATTAGTCSTGTTLANGGTITVSASETVMALGTLSGDTNSSVAAAAYTIDTSVTNTPNFEPPAGTYSSAQTVTMVSSTPGATICYTTNGTTPAAATPGTCSVGTTVASGASITVGTTETVQALATMSGRNNSSVASAAYTINPLESTPTFNPAAGTYNSSQTVTITSSTSGATICYTTNGSAPTATTAGTCSNGTTLTDGGTVTVSSSETLEAIATASNHTNSTVGTAAYTINLPNVATPTFSPTPGPYSSSQTVSITSSTSGATICYTTNGTVPAASTAGTCSSGNTLTNGGSITVSASEIVEAIGTLSGDNNSSVATGSFTINTQTAATPTLSPGTGTYSSAQTVAISSATAGATICYTLDGSTPTASPAGTCGNGAALTNNGSISVSSSETVQAIATLSGDTNSAVASAAYTISLPANLTVGVNPGSATLNAGGSVALNVTATGSGTISSPTFSCAGLPSYATCQWSSPTMSGQTVSTVLTLAVSSQVSAVQDRGTSQIAMTWFGTTGFGLFGLVFVSGKRRRKAGLLLVAVALFCLAGLQGCAGLVKVPNGSTGSATPTAFTFTVTGSVKVNGTTATNSTTVGITVN